MPSSKFRILAAPTDPDSDMKAFCVDESGIMKSVTGGKSSVCFTRGKPVNTGSGTTYGVD
jgi:hypothetical protein